MTPKGGYDSDKLRALNHGRPVDCTASSIFECLFPLYSPQRPRVSPFVALELVGHPYQRTEDDGSVVAGEINDAGFDDETAEFDQMPRALAALDLPPSHIMSRPRCLMPVACRPVALERR